MIKPKLLLCADTIIIDSRTNNISVVNFFEEINPEAFPIFLSRFSVLLVFERDEGDPEQQITKLRFFLGEQQLVETDATIEFQGKKRSRHILILSGFPIPQPGVLSTRAFVVDEEVLRYDIAINPARAKPEILQTTSPSNQ